MSPVPGLSSESMEGCKFMLRWRVQAVSAFVVPRKASGRVAELWALKWEA